VSLAEEGSSGSTRPALSEWDADTVVRIVKWLRARGRHHARLAREWGAAGNYVGAYSKDVRAGTFEDIARALEEELPFQAESTWT